MSVLLLALLVMLLLGSGTYLILRQHAMKLILGLGLISHAFNLIIFSATGLTAGTVPILPLPPRKADELPEADHFADPLPHALILTAIVIGFGVTAYLIALIQRLHEVRDGADYSAGTAYHDVEHFSPGRTGEPDDYMYLEDTLNEPPIGRAGADALGEAR